jgi:hypothetical protein
MLRKQRPSTTPKASPFAKRPLGSESFGWPTRQPTRPLARKKTNQSATEPSYSSSTRATSACKQSPIVLTLCPAEFDRHVLTIVVAVFGQSATERGQQIGIARCCARAASGHVSRLRVYGAMSKKCYKIEPLEPLTLAGLTCGNGGSGGQGTAASLGYQLRGRTTTRRGPSADERDS